jgi:hypothetical protein
MKFWDKFCYGMGILVIVVSSAFLIYGVATDRRDVVGYQHK